MKNFIVQACRLAAAVLLFFSADTGTVRAQQQAPQDTTRGLPTLEIPEITIIGKKAITLPFARKGEIFDVSVAEVPPPDTSLLESRPAMTLPVGALPRYEEPLVPLHVSVEGNAGSYTSAGGRGYISYKNQQWGFDGNAGFSSSHGHVDHATYGAFEAGARARTIVSTDNDFLKSFRVTLGANLLHDSYGMFGRTDGYPDRARNNFVLDAAMQSLDHTSNEVGVSLSANIWSVRDSRNGIDSSVSVVSPSLGVSYRTGLGGSVKLMSDLRFSSSALNYSRSVQSPALTSFGMGVQFELTRGWLLEVGGNIETATGSSGENPSLVTPYGTVRWLLDADREVRFWFRPEIVCPAYGDRIRAVPYLDREMVLEADRQPVNFGGSFWFNSSSFSVELRGSFTHSTSTMVVLADSAGRLVLAPTGANSFIAEAIGTLHASSAAAIRFSGAVHPAYFDGTTTLLPMNPLLTLGARAEYAFGSPITLWMSADYTSKQNVDAQAVTTLGDKVLFGAGASSSLIPRTVLSVDIENLLNTGYDWWYGYQAPGITLMVNARVNIR